MEHKWFFFSCFFLLLIANLFLAVVVFRQAGEDVKPDFSRKETPFSFLSPKIARVDEKSFVVLHDKFVPSYKLLREKLVKYFKSADGVYGVYFEDLYSGTWTGVSEREPFTPASLLKVPLAASVLKTHEDGLLDLDENITIAKDDLDNAFGNLFFHGENGTYSVKSLLEVLITNSDNTAANSLRKLVSDERLIEGRLFLGLPVASIIAQNDNVVKLTPKDLSHLFRALYFSVYTNRENSEYLLQLLTETHFNTLLKAGAPADIVVAHKYASGLKKAAFTTAA